LLDQDLPNKFADILERHNVMPTSFCLEITESAIMDDPVRAQITLERLHGMGVDLSIDDFGTGYSSLAYLKSLPVDELKIDKSFVLKMEKDVDDVKIVRSTIDLGHNMGLRVVADGVENAEVMALLKERAATRRRATTSANPCRRSSFPLGRCIGVRRVKRPSLLQVEAVSCSDSPLTRLRERGWGEGRRSQRIPNCGCHTPSPPAPLPQVGEGCMVFYTKCIGIVLRSRLR
jgi:hypothetical protein